MRIIVVWFLLVSICFASDRELVLKHEIPAECRGMALTMIHDAQGKPYLYVASKDAGLKIYRIERKPVLARIISGPTLRGLHVMNLSQAGDYLYLALGNHFGIAQQNPGFAIIDVSHPEKASVVSVWSNTNLKKWCGCREMRWGLPIPGRNESRTDDF